MRRQAGSELHCQQHSAPTAACTHAFASAVVQTLTSVYGNWHQPLRRYTDMMAMQWYPGRQGSSLLQVLCGVMQPRHVGLRQDNVQVIRQQRPREGRFLLACQVGPLLSQLLPCASRPHSSSLGALCVGHDSSGCHLVLSLAQNVSNSQRAMPRFCRWIKVNRCCACSPCGGLCRRIY